MGSGNSAPKAESSKRQERSLSPNPKSENGEGDSNAVSARSSNGASMKESSARPSERKSSVLSIASADESGPFDKSAGSPRGVNDATTVFDVDDDHPPPLQSLVPSKSRHRITEFVNEELKGDDTQAMNRWKRHSITELSVGQSIKKHSRAALIVHKRVFRRKTVTALESSNTSPSMSMSAGMGKEKAYVLVGEPQEKKVATITGCYHQSSPQDILSMTRVNLSVPGANKDVVREACMKLEKLSHVTVQGVVEAYTPREDDDEDAYTVIQENVSTKLSNAAFDVFTRNVFMECVRDLCRGLRYLHANKIYHSNIGIDSVHFRNPQCQGIVIANCSLGPIYRALSVDWMYENGLRNQGLYTPERVREDPDRNPALEDVWAAGVLVYYLLCGKMPFTDNGDKDEFLKNVLMEEITFPDDTPEQDVDMVLQLLSRDPEDRPEPQSLLRRKLFREMGGESMIFSESVEHSESSSTTIESSNRLGNNLNMTISVTPDILTEREKTILDMTGYLPEGVLEAERTQCLDASATGGLQKKKSRKLMSEAEACDDMTVEEEIEFCLKESEPELHLGNRELAELPKSMFDPPLDCIVMLDLYNNKLKELPAEIRYLVSLNSLVLGNNELESLPDELGDLSELSLLDANHNKLKTPPQPLMFCDQLSTLALDYNEFEEFPDVIADIPSLKTVYLAANPKLKTWPSLSFFSDFVNIQIGVDNEPNLFSTSDQIVRNPMVQIMWNKVYPDKIVDGIFCGSIRSAQTPHVFKQLDIGFVLTTGRGLEPKIPDDVRHKTIIVDDVPGATIDDTFDDAVEFIEEATKAKRGCLVHCFAGMSRSATTVIAYLMRKRGMRLDDAYLTTKKGRPAIYPNEGFFKQLVKFDEKLYPDGRPVDVESLHREIVP